MRHPSHRVERGGPGSSGRELNRVEVFSMSNLIAAKDKGVDYAAASAARFGVM